MQQEVWRSLRNEPHIQHIEGNKEWIFFVVYGFVLGILCAHMWSNEELSTTEKVKGPSIVEEVKPRKKMS